jgi:hypothetical protein
MKFFIEERIANKSGGWVNRAPGPQVKFEEVTPTELVIYDCSIEIWFSILQRKRFGIVNFKNLEELAERIAAFVGEWNEKAPPFKWTRQGGARLIERLEQKMAKAASVVESGNLNAEVNEAALENGEGQDSVKEGPRDYSLQPEISLREGLNIGQSRSKWQYALVA